jgi:hypothetical protein
MLTRYAALAPMTRLRWGDMDNVGDESIYVNSVQACLVECLPPLRKVFNLPAFPGTNVQILTQRALPEPIAGEP